jgi:hypothetical protein
MGIVLYATAIHEAIARGDQEEMQTLLRQAEEHVGEWGNMPVALELLRAEALKTARGGDAG